MFKNFLNARNLCKRKKILMLPESNTGPQNVRYHDLHLCLYTIYLNDRNFKII